MIIWHVMKFYFENTAGREAVKSYIDKCKDGVMFVVEIKRQTRQRTILQNRLYWLYVACIMDETGNDRETIHYELRRRFLPIRTGELAGEQIERLTSTTELNTAQFKAYIDRIVEFAQNELSIVLPNPDDLCFEAFYSNYKDFI